MLTLSTEFSGTVSTEVLTLGKHGQERPSSFSSVGPGIDQKQVAKVRGWPFYLNRTDAHTCVWKLPGYIYWYLDAGLLTH